uniref:Uncharacterized protein n=1 Tax=Sphaerodactylus townsendi TaxID=933632 RepID=A0ACB8G7A5_9SAUR
MATARPSSVPTKMAPPPPVSRCSAAATAALEHLQGVEKQLQNEGLVFDMGTVQHLEEAIQAIKKLEGERKRILELLEEETIKNCNLRVKIKGMPQIVMEEFEALVAAARRAQVLKITEIEASAQEVESVVERTHSKQNFSEQHNLALSEEQKEFGDKQEKTVDILNQQLATKNSFYIQVNELLNMERDEEEESAFQINATDELEKEIVWAVSVFEKEQALLESQTADLQSKLLALKLQIAQKSMEYEALLAILCALQKQVEEKKQAIQDRKAELAKLLETIKRLLKKYGRKKAEKEEILQKKAKLQTGQISMDSDFREEAEALLQQLAESEEEMLCRSIKRLKNENDLLRRHSLGMVFQEERKFNTGETFSLKRLTPAAFLSAAYTTSMGKQFILARETNFQASRGLCF